MAESMRSVNFLVLASVFLALAAVLPQCLAQEPERRLFTTTTVKKQRSVDLKKGFRRRRNPGASDRFSQGSTEGDEVVPDMPRAFKKPEFRDPRGAGLHQGRRLQSLAEQEGVLAKEWPLGFTIGFTTNWGAATGILAYDWANKRMVEFHGPNSTFCTIQGTDDGCQMFEVPSGTYVYVPSQKKCTLLVEGFGSLPPNWTVQSNYVGVELVPDVGLCRTFALPPTDYIWAETVEGGLPCFLVSPDPSSTYYFDPQTFKLGAPDKKLFEFPDFCFVPSGSAESIKRSIQTFFDIIWTRKVRWI